MKYQVVSTVGAVRTTNQDNYYMNGLTKPRYEANIAQYGESEDPHQLFAVCDGMGGESYGDVAAELAVKHLSNYSGKNFSQNWEGYIKETNEIICNWQKEQQVRMGTTFAGLSVDEGHVLAINVGDSRIYRITGSNIQQLSLDHNEYQAMLDIGIKINERMKRIAQSSLTQCLGIPENEMVLVPHVVELSHLRGTERFLLCSDGLSSSISEERMKQLIENATGMQEIWKADMEQKTPICKELIEEAIKCGSSDNITAMLITITNNDAE